MRPRILYPVLKAALIAGLIAGLAYGTFHFVLTEPVIDQAIALEEAARAPGQASQYVPVVSRVLQKAMLLVGSALYGLVLGVIFAAVFALLHRRLPGRWPDVKAEVLALLLWWSVFLLPFLKYPANPPGVGDPDTVYYRQTIQIIFIGLSVLAVAATAFAYWLSARKWQQPGPARMVFASAVYAVLMTLIFWLMPANPDPVVAPADLVWHFRILSMGGQAVLWAAMGMLSALLLKRLVRQGRLEPFG